MDEQQRVPGGLRLRGVALAPYLARRRFSITRLRPRLLLALLLAPPALGASAHERGRDLFMGREALRGRIRNHASSLPPDVVVCSNCHAPRRERRPEASRAPRVDRALLLEPHARRGGPPSVYTEQAFCKLLRTGIDPAHVLISREMPVYAVDAAQCASLWQFLTDEGRP
jgi:hypothetical protein